MSAHTYNTIFNTGETYHCLTDFVQSTQSPSKQVYPFLYKADCQPGALEQRTAITYQEYGLPPSTAPSLSSSVSSPLSASSGDDEDIPHMIRTRISPAFSNDLVQRISLVDKLVETTSSVIVAIWGPAVESQSAKVVSTAQFVREILKRSKTTYSTLQAALYYIFRIKASVTEHMVRRQAAFPMEKPAPKDCIFCGRRMFLAALMVASKFLQDRTYRNSAWAKISGLTTAEITFSEMTFLQLIDYQLFISKNTFDRWQYVLSSHINQLMTTLHARGHHSMNSMPSNKQFIYIEGDNGCAKQQHRSYCSQSEAPATLVASKPQLKRVALRDLDQPRKKMCQ